MKIENNTYCILALLRKDPVHVVNGELFICNGLLWMKALVKMKYCLFHFYSQHLHHSFII